jgi:WD40 repeat protein
VVWKRSRQTSGFTAHATSIRAMLVVGTTLITASETEVRTWDVDVLCECDGSRAEAALLTTIALPAGFALTCMIHPPTYVNKVVIGSEDGALAVWNVSTCKLKFTSTVCEGAAITALEPSPAVDVLGVGLADGRILVHNIKLDKVPSVLVCQSCCVFICCHHLCPVPRPCVNFITVQRMKVLRLGQLPHCHSARIRCLIRTYSRVVTRGPWRFGT